MRAKQVTVMLAVLLWAGCGGRPAGEAESAAFRQYDARTFFMTTSFGAADSHGFAFSPDGRRILVSDDESGVFNARSIDIQSGVSTELTASAGSAVFAVSYFPGDERVLFTADQDGNELDHVYVQEPDGSRRDLTPGEKLKASFAGWSGDGKHFYLLTNERDGKDFDLYAYAAAGYGRVLLFRNDQGWGIDSISRDARWLALVKNRTSADNDLFLVDLDAASPQPRRITPHQGNVSHSVLTFTPGSRKLYYLTDEHGEFAQAWSYDLSSGEKELVYRDDWDVVSMGFSPRGTYQVRGVNADARTVVRIVEAATGGPVALPPLPPGELRSVRFSADDGQVAFFINSDTSPSNLFVVDLAGGGLKQLTHSLNPEIHAGDLVEGRVIRYPSFDDLMIPALLYRPRQATADRKAPALVFVHGGPGGQTTRGYRALIQHLVNHGYAVLGVNNRGSSGYGKTFNHLDDRHHGEGDLQDVVWGRRYLETLDWVDGGRVGVMGGSYGGYMTVAALAFHPEAFEVGIDVFGVTNWERTLKSIPPWWEAFKESLYDEMGDPATDQERHHRISPLFHARKIQRPLLVVQGKNDPRVLKVESDEMVAAVRANGVPVKYIVFPDEGHGFRKRENRIAASEAYLAFLDRYLRR
ncbi:MAG: S9 family peptidase [Acidobacteriota bacterium]